MDTINLWVAVPAFNEEKTIKPLLVRLHEFFMDAQNFMVVVCDNNSTDGTVSVVEKFFHDHDLPWAIIKEEVKGTGAAADTAIRFAVSQGATHVMRTDADCLPTKGWLNEARKFFAQGVGMISGRITVRRDDTNITNFQAKVFNLLVPVASLYGKFRPLNRGSHFKGPYVMTPGCNMGITSQLYMESGGFPRTKIEDVHEDHVLVNRVRKITNKYGFYRDVHVKVSARRIQAWGIVNTLKWYADHSYRPEIVDIR